MRCSVAPLAGLMVMLAVSACADGADETATAPDLRRQPPGSCNFQTASQLAGAIFVPPQKQVVFGLITQMEAATGATRDNFGFDVLAAIANGLNAGTLAGTPTQAAAAANAIIACQSFAPAQPLDLLAALDPLVDGAFEVRGGPNDPTFPVVSRLAPHYSAIGVKSGTWFEAFGERVLIYGAPNTNATKGGQLPGSQAYDWNTLPLNPSLAARTLVVGLCAFTGRSLIEEESGNVDAVVAYEDVANLEAAPGANGRKFCDLITQPRTGRLFGWLRDVFAPTPLHAALLSPPGTGGLARGFSTFFPVDAGSIQLSFPQGGEPKPREKVNQTITIQVQANAQVVTGNGTVVNAAPIEGVVLSMRVIGNSGGFTLTPPAPTATTGPNGIATLTFTLDQPGGYQIEITSVNIVNASQLRGYDPVTILTKLFHLNR
jgi:hypothetical protein